MTATTTQGTGNGSVENSLPRIQNNVKRANLDSKAVSSSNMDTAPVFLSGSVTASKALHANRVVCMNNAAGLTVTLPLAKGTGSVYKFFVGTSVTSNNYIIKVGASSDIMSGRAYICQDGGNSIIATETATGGSASDTITLNGTTTGGLVGDMVELVDVGVGVWYVAVHMTATGTEATPFSATV